MNYPGKQNQGKLIIPYPLLSAGVAVILIATSCMRPPDMETLPYQQFVAQVEQGQVERVNLSADRSRAVVIPRTGPSVAVNLPSDPDLILLLQQNNVDIAVLPPEQPEYPSFTLPLVLLMVVMVAGCSFWVWVLIDCTTQEASTGNTKLVWVLIILLANLPGALLYALVRRPQRLRESGPP